MDYNNTYQSYMSYVNKCRDVIKSTFFTEKDTLRLDIKDNSLGINEIVRRHRLKMIDIKLDHTMRMIEQVIKINENLGFKVDLALVIKVAVLYHDIGRMRQSTWSNTFGDSIYKTMNSPFNNHGEDGYDIFMNNNFNIDDKYVPIIGQSILHHQDLHTISKLNYRYDSNLRDININDIVTGNIKLNDAEWQVVSLITQLVADIDKSDILYQHLSDDFDMIRDYVFDKSKDSLDNIAKNWGISKREILEYNNIDENNYEPRTIKIPIENVSIDKLEVPKYMKDMFYDNSWPELRVLIQDKNWNFICILWWRLSHFLNEISFSSTLINIEESKLLEQIYDKIPNKLRPLVDEAFEYAKEFFVEKRIKENEGNIYLKR